MRSGVMIIIAAAVMAGTLYPCDTIIVGRHPHPIDVAREIVKGADVIVRATAVEYAIAPQNNRLAGSVRFKVAEVIKGKPLAELILEGQLVDRDDFNELPAPYQQARSNAQAGSCWAWQYKTGAQYLLMLKKERPSGLLTVKWYPLAPVNEQLHSGDDPWLLWVRTQAKRSGFLHRR
jgi:hypothetical protein